MSAKHPCIAAIGAVLVSLWLPAVAQSLDALVQRYTLLAGSEENARALVSGLRDGTTITLSGAGAPTVIDSPTARMGYGSIDNALALTDAALAKRGIDSPDAEQLKASLLEVLQARAEGRGWGEIANSMGVRLGELKRAQVADVAVERSRGHRPDRPERPEKPARPEKPERPMRPGR